MWSPTSRSGRRSYLALWDLCLAVIAPILALYLRDPLIFNADLHVVGYYWLFSAGLTLLALWAFRLQDGITRYFSLHETLDIAEAVLFAELTTFVVLFTVTRLDGIPRSIPLIHGPLLAVGLIAARLFMRGLLSAIDEPQDFRCRPQRIIIIGANRFATDFVRMLQAYAPQHKSVVAILDDGPAMVGQTISGVRVLGKPLELDGIVTEFAVHGVTVDRLVIAGEADAVTPAVMHELEQICRKRHINLCFLPRLLGLTEQTTTNLAVAMSQPAPIEVAAAPRPYLRFKRVFDVVGSLLLVILLFPVLLIATILVHWDVGRPILFWQERVGWKGRTFLIYKFRTLKAPFDSSGRFIPNDRQPTAIGRMLRSTRIDELPQLLNVILGDMSLIGPRPLLPEDQPAESLTRLSVRPGITGWAQVNGAKLLPTERKVQLDDWYVQNASLWLDLRIAIMTLIMMIHSRTQSEEALADKEQVQGKNSNLEQSVAAPSLAAPQQPILGIREPR
jgi:lipopolysaccharide/colanic/teichoic acid biosynthesis glycosyltransferase